MGDIYFHRELNHERLDEVNAQRMYRRRLDVLNTSKRTSIMQNDFQIKL